MTSDAHTVDPITAAIHELPDRLRPHVTLIPADNSPGDNCEPCSENPTDDDTDADRWIEVTAPWGAVYTFAVCAGCWIDEVSDHHKAAFTAIRVHIPATEAQRMAGFLTGLADHLAAHPDLVPVNVHYTAYQPFDVKLQLTASMRRCTPAELAAWVRSLGCSLATITRYDEGRMQVSARGLLGGRTVRVWDMFDALCPDVAGDLVDVDVLDSTHETVEAVA